MFSNSSLSTFESFDKDQTNTVDHDQSSDSQSNQEKAIETLIAFMNAVGIPDDFPEQPEPSLNKTKKPMSRDQATIILQRHWRNRKFANLLFSEQGRKLYEDILDIQYTDDALLEKKIYARTMFGKTIAAVRHDNINSNTDFPIEQSPDWSYGKDQMWYHRDDEFLTGPIYDEFIRGFNLIPEYHLYTYLPISIVKNSAVKSVISTYLTPAQRQRLTIYEKDGVGLIRVEGDDPEVLTLLKQAGSTLSPIEIAKFNAKLQSAKQKNTSKAKTKNISQLDPKKTILSNYLSTLPATIEDLKSSRLVVELSKIAVDSSNPNHLLAACLHRMITGLPNMNLKDLEIVKRISLFLTMGVYLFKHNYARFGFMVYAITHEFSLLFNDALENGTQLVCYNDFLKNTERDHFRFIGETDNRTAQYFSVAAPAMSGMHAFMIALDLAKTMTLKKTNSRMNAKLTVGVEGPRYFEAYSFIHKEPVPNKGEIADIYVLSAGAIADDKGIVPGIDVNLFIKNRLLDAQGNMIKPVTIIIDITTALNKNLKLDSEVNELVQQGKLSLIYISSYLKFSADYYHSGVVFAKLSAAHFNHSIVVKFRENAEQDFASHLDMMATTYIRKHCGVYVDEIKQQNFINGALFRSFFVNDSDYQDYTLTHQNMLTDLNELYFVGIKNNDNLMQAAFANSIKRDSFGHFSTTSAIIKGEKEVLFRLSPNASDILDALIEITQLYLTSKFDINQLFDMAVGLVGNNLTTKFNSLKLEIILTAILLGIRNVSIASESLKLHDQFLLLYCIQSLELNCSSFLAGRNAYQTLINTKNQSNTRTKSLLFQDEKSFISKELFANFFNQKPSYETIVAGLNELVELSAYENSKNGGSSLVKKRECKAKLAIILSNWWTKKIPGTKISFAEFDYKAHRAICYVISMLKNKNLLTFDLACKLMANSNHGDELAKKIIEKKDLLKTFNAKILNQVLITFETSTISNLSAKRHW